MQFSQIKLYLEKYYRYLMEQNVSLLYMKPHWGDFLDMCVTYCKYRPRGKGSTEVRINFPPYIPLATPWWQLSKTLVTPPLSCAHIHSLSSD